MPRIKSYKIPKRSTLRYFRKVLNTPEEARESVVPTAEDYDGLFKEGRQFHLLFDTYSEEAVAERLEHYGVMDKLRAKGFDDVLLRFDFSDPNREQVFLYDAEERPECRLVEAAFHDGTFSTRASFAGELRRKPFRMLFIQWLCLQNSRRSFTRQRPALPGQLYPGLKIGREVMAMLIALAEKLGRAGLLNIPEFAHAAVLYSERFKYLNPRAEGLLQAIRRDLGTRTLAESSWGFQVGAVRLAETGAVFPWFREEQVLALHPLLIEHFESEPYRRVVEKVRETHHFVFDEAEWKAKFPLREDGSPKVLEERGWLPAEIR